MNLRQQNGGLRGAFNGNTHAHFNDPGEFLHKMREFKAEHVLKATLISALFIANFAMPFNGKAATTRYLQNKTTGFIPVNKIRYESDQDITCLERELQSEKAKTDAVLLMAIEERLSHKGVMALQTAELTLANEELILQEEDRIMRAAELVVANTELHFQNIEKENRAAELVLANKELLFQNGEKEKRASELVLANKELLFQNGEKEKRAAELVTANKELLFQNIEKEKRAAELVVANKELLFQNEEKEKRAAELVVANEELIFQNEEKAKRAAELLVANKELVFQNEEKEKRAAELLLINQELKIAEESKESYIRGLEQLMFLTSHRVRQPVANIMGIANVLRTTESSPEEIKKIVGYMQHSAVSLDEFTKELTEYIEQLKHKFKIPKSLRVRGISPHSMDHSVRL